MHEDYVEDSMDHSIDTPRIFDIIKETLSNPGSIFHFWLLLNGEEVIGFAITDFLMGQDGPEMNIAQAYISPKFRFPETQKLTLSTFEKFAREKGCVYLTSATRRDPVMAYIRWMGRGGFKKRFVVMEKDLRGS